MRKYLLPEKGKFYKANLHSHSRHSDGWHTPVSMRDAYKEKGYSILAVTDHDVLREHYECTQDDFLMLTGYEISIRSDDDPTPHALRKVVDLNLIAKAPYNVTQIGYHPDSVQYWREIRSEEWFEWLMKLIADDLKICDKPYYQREALEWLKGKQALKDDEFENIKYAGELRDMHIYPENINKIIKSANENGFLVSLNHNSWSNTNFEYYSKYEGLWAMEIYNHGSYVFAGLPDDEPVFADMLRAGKQIYAIATDDNHNNTGINPWEVDSYGGFTMIKAEKLDYPTVIDAMEKGHFYASQGPEIYELYYEDGKVHIECSPCADICMNTLGRAGKRVCSDGGSLITSADFEIDKKLFGGVRFRVRDEHGKKAFTNMYYVDEFMDDAEKIRAIL